MQSIVFEFFKNYIVIAFGNYSKIVIKCATKTTIML